MEWMVGMGLVFAYILIGLWLDIQEAKAERGAAAKDLQKTKEDHPK